MKIRSLRWGNRKGEGSGVSYAAELAVEDENGAAHYITVALLDNTEGVSVTASPLFDGEPADAEESYENEIDASFTDGVFASSRFYPEIRLARFALESYLGFDTEPEPSEAEAFIADYAGQDAAELAVPMATYGYDVFESEGYEGFDDDYSFLIAKIGRMKPDEIMKCRLAAEEAVAEDPNGADGGIAEYISALAGHCESEEAWLAWKDDYIRGRMRETEDKQLLTVRYLFAGFDELTTVLPAEEIASIREMEAAGSARILEEPRPATPEEIRHYIALNADSDCGEEE